MGFPGAHFEPIPKAMMELPLRVRKYLPPGWRIECQASRSYTTTKVSDSEGRVQGVSTLINLKPARSSSWLAERTAWKAREILVSHKCKSGSEKLRTGWRSIDE